MFTHVLGLDTQNSMWYCYWSGVGTQVNLTMLVGAAAWWLKHSCHRRSCLLVGRHQVGQAHYCRRHKADAALREAPVEASAELRALLRDAVLDALAASVDTRQSQAYDPLVLIPRREELSSER